MKKLMLIALLTNSLSHTMEMNDNDNNKVNPYLHEDRVMGLGMMPTWKTIKRIEKTIPGCEFCTATCVCCFYIAIMSGDKLFQSVRNKLKEEETARRME